MRDQELLSKSGGIFRKKILALVVVLIIGGGIGAYFIFGDFFSRQNAEETIDVTQIPPPDLVPQSWLERHFGTTNVNDPKVGGIFGDPDGDRLTNYQEYLYGTDPLNRDTDGDLYFDGTEIAYGSNPLGEGARDESADIETTLRQYGIDINQEEIRQEFSEYFGIDRELYVNNYTLDDLTITDDHSPETINEYYQSFLSVTAYTNSPEVEAMTSTFFATTTPRQIQNFINAQTEVNRQMKELPVPAEIAPLHLIYLKNFDALLGMAKFALEQIEAGKVVGSGKFYPELSYILKMDDELAQLKKEIFDKYNIAM